MKDTRLDPIKELAKSVDTKLVNELLEQTDLNDFEMTKATIENIAEWCLNGNSDTEIRQKLSLNKHQWGVLVACCPTLLVVMQQSRSLAEVVLAGSLYQRAIGGKVIKKQQLVRIHEYDENGKVCGEHYETMWVQEELPPEPSLLKFLAEKKLNEKLGENANKTTENYKNVVNNLTDEDLEKLEKMSKVGKLNG